MDFKHCVSKAVDDVVQRFIRDVSQQYNIDCKELQNIWSGDNNHTAQIETKSHSSSNTNSNNLAQNTVNSDNDPKSINLTELPKCTVAELKGMCKDRGLKCSGKKADLLSRLVNGDKPSPNKPVVPSKPTKKKVDTQDVIKQLKANASSSIQLRRNTFGNYQHPHSDLIFNEQKKVYGVQKDDGTVEKLNAESIDLCNKYNFDYVIPDNLNTSDNDIDIEEFNSDDDVEEEDVEEEDVEESIDKPPVNASGSMDSDTEDDVNISEEELLEEEEEEEELLDEDEYY